MEVGFGFRGHSEKELKNTEPILFNFNQATFQWKWALVFVVTPIQYPLPIQFSLVLFQSDHENQGPLTLE